VLALLAETPDLSIPELAQRIGKSASAIERAIRKLREAGRLARVGPDKGGHWQVLDQDGSKERR
ncbi:UNVERIFIED_CONTAM: winged helix-turn-helix transcriptional regulator, partial [Salmonella enterica subsp. enterica serovar Weltevreden]